MVSEIFVSKNLGIGVKNHRKKKAYIVLFITISNKNHKMCSLKGANIGNARMRVQAVRPGSIDFTGFLTQKKVEILSTFFKKSLAYSKPLI